MSAGSVADYLAMHYRTAAQLASACGVETPTLMARVGAGLVPAPSYRVDAGRVLHSVVFGRFAGCDAIPGVYFHPGVAAWVRRASIARGGRDDQAARRILERGFKRRYAATLRRLHRGGLRLDDSFDASATPKAAGLQARCDTAWVQLMEGTYGLCVADCGSVTSIALKDVLQEHLTRQAEGDVPSADRERVLRLVSAYAAAAMPFSPIEYPASSRKRLVDDFSARLRIVTA